MNPVFLPPVAFFIFRRPSTTQRVFDVIAKVKPARLFIIADGPRSEDEAEQCAQARAIVEHIDWDCTVARSYSDTNMGLKQRIQTGLNWVFEEVEEAVILEDDCLPDSSFFHFCRELLDYYRHESRVMHISGDYFHPQIALKESYYFSRYPHVWGWATWRRAWQHYEPEMDSWGDKATRRKFLSLFSSAAEQRFWQRTIDDVRSGQINTWDYQWAYTCIRRQGLCINPKRNLVSNIGFHDDATHTVDDNSTFAEMTANEFDFPLIHPSSMARNDTLDEQTARLFFSDASALRKIYQRIRHHLSPSVIRTGIANALR